MCISEFRAFFSKAYSGGAETWRHFSDKLFAPSVPRALFFERLERENVGKTPIVIYSTLW